jgi:hypothetical protein
VKFYPINAICKKADRDTINFWNPSKKGGTLLIPGSAGHYISRIPLYYQ